MAGHSKWANIKHRKASQDAKRGKAFTKIIKEITVVARDGGGNPDDNPRLRTLLEKARHLNMPIENSTRAIKKGTGELPGVNYESHTYEGHGPHGIAIIVETLTDNKNRSVAEIRHAFSKGGGSMGSSGSVGWMFDRLGMIKVAKGKHDEDEMLELLIEHDITDINIGDDIIFVTCAPSATDAVKKTLEEHGLTVESADLEWVAKEATALDDDAAEKAINFLHALEDLDDVQNVYTNLG
jgi:YebC/PmpR family DNA-binding regulatory protein